LKCPRAFPKTDLNPLKFNSVQKRSAKRSFGKILTGILVACFGGATVNLTAASQVLPPISAANIDVVQNDTNNNSTSVTVTTALSINDFRIRSGSNRADYDVQIGDSSTDDVSNGVLICSLDQNGRDNGEPGFPGMNYGTCAVDSNASTSPGSSGEWWIPVFQVPQNAEYNFNVAAAYFPYANGWYGGWLNNSSGNNGGANNHFIGNTNLVLGTHVIDLGSGKTTVNLRPFGLDSRSNAVLLVVGGKNEANFALSTTNSDGTWTVFCHDDNVSGATYEQDYIAFVCVPLTNQTVVAGRFMGDASIAMQSAPFKVTNPGIGTYHLSIPGVNPANGVLIISAEGGGSNNVDNIVSYQTNLDGWDIQTRDITPGVSPALQNLSGSDAVVSFVYLPGPTPGSTEVFWRGSPTNSWSVPGTNDWRMAGTSIATNYADANMTVFDDSASNFTVNVAGPVSPYAVFVSNTTHDYVFNGSGGINGPAAFTKQGAGKVTLGIANAYTGDTSVNQGTLILGATNCLPGGNGCGDLTVNGTLDVNGISCTVNNLSGYGMVDIVTAGGAVSLTVNEVTNTTFSGALKNTTGTLALNLCGGGALTLSGISSFNGGCTVSNSTLMVNGSLVSSAVTVQANGTLGGSGTISGPVSLAGNTSLKLSAGVPLTVGSLALNGPVSVTVPGNYSFTNAATYTLLRYSAKTGSGTFTLVPPVGLTCNGFAATLQDTGTQLQMVVTPLGITGTLADVRHVVVFMNENRSFDHYFGTFHGVRGFNDRNAVRFTNSTSDFYQPSGSSYELPFHNSIQCLSDLNHSWPVTHAAVDSGKDDQWIANKGAETMAYYDRGDLPFYYALADAYTICDEYHCGVLSSTDPNRFTLMTGTIDPNSRGGGPEIDNTRIASGYTWTTYPEMLQQGGISWKVYQVSGDNSDNVLPAFATFKQVSSGNPLYDRGMSAYPTMSDMVNAFQADVQSNTLPLVSYIIGPSEYTEHPPYSPANGEVLTKELLDALASNPAVYNSTVFILNYDENDGFYDHAMPILPPAGTPDEYVGSYPIGLGMRVPAIIVSPWTRGGRVCSQVFDHTSISRFLEAWTGVKNTNISVWRRQVCGDLTSAFDFAHPNTNYPSLPTVSGITCDSGSTPSVPSPQTFPTQEPGSLVSMPLPYQPNAVCTLNSSANTSAITMTNSGAASVHFGVYPNAYRNDGPWPFDVNTATNATTVFSLSGTSGKYDFSCYGPDGFQRRFAGNVSADYNVIEATAFINPGNAGAKIELVNSSASSVTFTVTNGYVVSGQASYVVPAHSTNVYNILSETNGGLYDVTVTANADSNFVRRFLGRVQQSTSGTTLMSSKNPSVQGDNITFTAALTGYGTPGGTVRFTTNGVAISAAVTLTNGMVVLNTAALGCGSTQVGVVYSGDALNSSSTNTLSQMVYVSPVIALNGPSPMTNWLNTTFVDPGAMAFDPCADLALPVTTFGTVNSTVPGSYQLQYVAGNNGNLATNTRTVMVVTETPPSVLANGVLTNGNFQFSFSGPATQPYRVLTSTNLSPATAWDVISTGVFETAPASFTGTNDSVQPMRFYRVVSP